MILLTIAANPLLRMRGRPFSFVLHHDALSNMLLCMRTTLVINDDVMRRAKRRAADERVPLRRLVERALRVYLKGNPRPAKAYRLTWRTERGRILPGVKLDDRDALFDLLEGRE